MQLHTCAIFSISVQKMKEVNLWRQKTQKPTNKTKASNNTFQIAQFNKCNGKAIKKIHIAPTVNSHKISTQRDLLINKYLFVPYLNVTPKPTFGMTNSQVKGFITNTSEAV